MTFVGFLVLHDPPKAGVAETIRELQDLGVRLKMVTGDNVLVAAQVARQVGLHDAILLTGSELRLLSDEALVQRVPDVDVFAQIEPNQKERIILAWKKAGHVVGDLGDGINDAPALHAADVGISVDTAVDIAREAADIVLLRHDVGCPEGRHHRRTRDVRRIVLLAACQRNPISHRLVPGVGLLGGLDRPVDSNAPPHLGKPPWASARMGDVIRRREHTADSTQSIERTAWVYSASGRFLRDVGVTADRLPDARRNDETTLLPALECSCES